MSRPVAEVRAPWWREATSGRRFDWIVLGGYLLLAVNTMRHLLVGSAERISWGNPRGQAFDEWMLAHGASVFTHGQSLWRANEVGIPGGVNPLRVHGFPGLSLPLAPLTILLGPAHTYAVAATACLVATGYAWYWLLSRRLIRHRGAAVIGGLLGGFGPAMVSHAQGDLSRTALFLLPALVWLPLRLRTGQRLVRTGVLLGLTAAWQLFIDDEVLIIAAVGWAVFLVIQALWRPGQVWRALGASGPGVASALVTFGVIAAYPVWVLVNQARPVVADFHQSMQGADVFSFVAFGMPSLATWPVGRLHYAPIATAQNLFFGWPLVALLVGVAVFVRSSRLRVLGISAGVLAVLSMGNDILVKGRDTHLPGPWRLVGSLPLLRSVAPTNLGIAVLVCVVLMVAFAIVEIGQRVDQLHTARPSEYGRLAWYGLLAAALLPVLPAPIWVTGEKVPAFVTAGTWRQYVPAGSTLMAIPAAAPTSTAWRWAVATDLALPLAGVDAGPLFAQAERSRHPSVVSDAQRLRMVNALREGRVAAVAIALPRAGRNLITAGTAVFGAPPVLVGGVYVWDVRWMSEAGL